MEDIKISLVELIANKTGMKVTDLSKAVDPLSNKEVVVAVFENGTRAICSIVLKMQANGKLVKD